MRGKKVFLDVLLVAAGMVGTLFLVYCSDSPSTTPILRPPPTVLKIYSSHFNPCVEELPVTFDSVNILFSEAMSYSSVLANIDVQPDTPHSITAPNWGYGYEQNQVFIIDFTDNLAYAETYTITVTAGTQSADHVDLESDYTYTFRTEPQAPPEVTRYNPDESSLLPSPELQWCDMFFSEAMSILSVMDHLSVSPARGFTTEWTYNRYNNFEHRMKLVFDEDFGYDTEFTVTVSAGAEDIEGQPLQSDFTFSFSTAPSTTRPFLRVVVPTPGAIDVPTSLESAEMLFSHSMSIQSVHNNVTIDPAESISWTGQGSDDFIMNFDDNLAYATTYTITIPSDIVDANGDSLLSGFTYSFTTRSLTPPLVIGTDPANSDTNVMRTIDAVVEFSEIMSELSVESAFAIAPSAPAAFSWSQCSDVLTANFDSSLAYSAVYTVTLGSEVMDDQGESMGSPHVFSFTTEPPVRPFVTDNFPAEGATNVPKSLEIEIQFSEDMLETSLWGPTIDISPPPEESFSVLYDSSTYTVTLDVILAYDTEYTVTIDTGAKDLEGFGMVSDHLFSFITEPLVRPFVTDNFPADGATNVSNTIEAMVTFSKAMSPMSVMSALAVSPVTPGSHYNNYDRSTDTLYVDFRDGLYYDTEYTITIGTGAMDMEGLGMASDHVFSFTTEVECPVTCGDLAITEPSDGQYYCADQTVSYGASGFTDCIDTIEWTLNSSFLSSGSLSGTMGTLAPGEHYLEADAKYSNMASTCSEDVFLYVSACEDYIVTLTPEQSVYSLGDDIDFNVVPMFGSAACIEQIAWYLNDAHIYTGPLLTIGATAAPAGTQTIRAEVKTAGFSTCTITWDYYVAPPCAALCGDLTFAQPPDSSVFYEGEEVPLSLGGSFGCIENVIFGSDVDGVLGSGLITSLNTSSLTPTTHTIMAQVISTGISTCEVTKALTVLDCPETCGDISFDLPTETTFSYGTGITFELGGNLDCVQNILWSSDVDGTLGSGETMTSLTTSALSISTHTITADVLSYNLTTCDKTKQVTILPFMGSNFFPDSGQTTCYDNTHALQASSCPAVGDTFYGQDATYINPPPAISLSANGDSTVTDNNTGLIWQQGYAGGFEYFWQEAVDACDALSLAGTSSWRLPSRRELVTITDYGRSYPALDTTAFAYPTGMYPYWTATNSAVNGSDAWFVDTSFGNLATDNKTFPAQLYMAAYSRCVLGDPLPAASLSNNGDSTVTDSASNLMWQDGIWATASTITWPEALAYCENLSQGAYTDWKLPDIKELESLVDADSYSPAIDTTAFVDQTNIDEAFWSSTTFRGLVLDAWAINFNTGGTRTGTKASMGFKIYVRCVRVP